MINILKKIKQYPSGEGLDLLLGKFLEEKKIILLKTLIGSLRISIKYVSTYLFRIYKASEQDSY